LLHDAVPLVYQLLSPLIQSSSALTTVELTRTPAGVGLAVGDVVGEAVGDDVGAGVVLAVGDGEGLDDAGGGPPPGFDGGVAPPPPPPPHAARVNSAADATSAAESRDGFMQS
jgi:hypothetical protein